MPSIRNTKKKAEMEALIKVSAVVWNIIQGMSAECGNYFLYRASAYDIDQLTQDLQQLKSKKDDSEGTY